MKILVFFIFSSSFSPKSFCFFDKGKKSEMGGTKIPWKIGQQGRAKRGRSCS
jgi:hypothetical protein